METYKLYLHAHVPTNDYVQCMCVFTRRCMHVYMTVYMNVCVLESQNLPLPSQKSAFSCCNTTVYTRPSYISCYTCQL